MSEKNDGPAHDQGRLHAHSAPTTQQIRTVGQRRRAAEEKLEHHLDEARHKKEHDHEHHSGAEHESETPRAGETNVDGGDIAAIQNDDRLTAADRVDLIANQALPEADENDVS
ncbi:hypothetical protein [Arthrobacter sp. B3I4]|uniref:hypothetical protein n=1 Tax=Arthrobacter sp. B3I4 TaxID=3042267 RepID=UPI002788AD1F|nr:hypothetical protein [Arthrobacter sp. B3I4]MDQ0756218.1 hypothetical protein [Arthrobacter sp. B3I4]